MKNLSLIFFIFSRDGKLLRNRDVKIEKLAIAINAKVLFFFFFKKIHQLSLSKKSESALNKLSLQ